MGNLIETVMNTLDCDYDEAARDCYPLFVMMNVRLNISHNYAILSLNGRRCYYG